MTIRRVRFVGHTAMVEVAPRDGSSPSVIPAPAATVIAAPYSPSGGLMAGTSDSSNDVATGTQTFVMNEFGLGFIAGQRVHIASQANLTTEWMEGTVVSYVEPTLTVGVDAIKPGAALGPYSDWSIGVTGLVGQTGAPGPIGPMGPTGPVPEAPTDGGLYGRKNAQWNSVTNSPALTGTPTAPTPPPGDNSTKLATTAFVAHGFQPLNSDLTGLSGLGSAAPSIGVMYYRNAVGVWDPVTVSAGLSFSGGSLGVSGGGFAPIASPALTGTPTAPTPAPGDSSTKLATTAFVGASFAPLASPVLTGNPTAPSPPTNDNSQSLPTTSWVDAKLAAFAPLASPVFTGAPQAPTPTPGDVSANIATTSFVHSSTASAIAGLASLASPIFVGDPQAPTAAAGDNDTSIATTAFVASAILAAGTGTGLADAPNDGHNYTRKSAAWSNIDATLVTLAPLASPLFTGTPQAPTPPTPDSSQTVATTAFVKNNLTIPSGTVMLFYQAAAPVGWTQLTTQNDKALRVVSGSTGGSAGGTNPFSTVMAQTAVGNHTLSTAELPGFTCSASNTITAYPYGQSGYQFPAVVGSISSFSYMEVQNTPGTGLQVPYVGGGAGISSPNYCQGTQGISANAPTGGGAHNHPLTMGIQYCDVILASKN